MSFPISRSSFSILPSYREKCQATWPGDKLSWFRFSSLNMPGTGKGEKEMQTFSQIENRSDVHRACGQGLPAHCRLSTFIGGGWASKRPRGTFKGLGPSPGPSALASSAAGGSTEQVAARPHVTD